MFFLVFNIFNVFFKAIEYGSANDKYQLWCCNTTVNIFGIFIGILFKKENNNWVSKEKQFEVEEFSKLRVEN